MLQSESQAITLEREQQLTKRNLMVTAYGGAPISALDPKPVRDTCESDYWNQLADEVCK